MDLKLEDTRNRAKALAKHVNHLKTKNEYKEQQYYIQRKKQKRKKIYSLISASLSGSNVISYIDVYKGQIEALKLSRSDGFIKKETKDISIYFEDQNKIEDQKEIIEKEKIDEPKELFFRRSLSKTKIVIRVILTGFVTLLYAIYFLYEEFLNKPEDQILSYFFINICSIKKLLEFMKNNILKLLFKNNKLKLLFKIFYFNNNLKLLFINNFNLVCYYKLNLFFVFLNFEDFKYEDDKLRF